METGFQDIQKQIE
jgi:hypothetical protein